MTYENIYAAIKVRCGEDVLRDVKKIAEAFEDRDMLKIENRSLRQQNCEHTFRKSLLNSMFAHRGVECEVCSKCGFEQESAQAAA